MCGLFRLRRAEAQSSEERGDVDERKRGREEATVAGAGDWPRVVVVGAGAVGCYFGGRLVRAGCPVTFLGRPGPGSSIEALARDGLYFDSPEFQESLRLDTSADPSIAGGAEIVLICVKTLDTTSAAASLAPHLRSSAIVVSLQNGV